MEAMGRTNSVASIRGEDTESHNIDSAVAEVIGVTARRLVLTSHCSHTHITKVSYRQSPHALQTESTTKAHHLKGREGDCGG